jgi:hypothetical protein
MTPTRSLSESTSQKSKNSLAIAVLFAWTTVGLYIVAGVIFANNYGGDRAFRIYTGFDVFTKGWYEDALIRPGMFWSSLIVALLLTRKIRNRT